jgi:CBS domain-containing protein
MLVQDVMSQPASVIDPNMTIRDAARKMRADNIGALPVGEDGHLIGMVTDRDIVMRAVAEERPPGDTAVREVMSGNIVCCYMNDDLDRAASLMAEHQVRRLAVLSRDKQLVGMVALADLARRKSDAAENALEGISEPNDQPRR